MPELWKLRLNRFFVFFYIFLFLHENGERYRKNKEYNFCTESNGLSDSIIQSVEFPRKNGNMTSRSHFLKKNQNLLVKNTFISENKHFSNNFVSMTFEEKLLLYKNGIHYFSCISHRFHVKRGTCEKSCKTV